MHISTEFTTPPSPKRFQWLRCYFGHHVWTEWTEPGPIGIRYYMGDEEFSKTEKIVRARLCLACKKFQFKNP